MAWHALSNLEDGRSMSWRTIGDPAEATEEEAVVPSEQVVGLTNPVWEAEQQRPVSLEEWYAARPNAPRGSGTPVFAPHRLEGTSDEPPDRIGSFGARLSYDHLVPSDEWTKVPFDEVLWDTGGVFDPRHGALVAPRNMECAFMAGGRIVIQYAVAQVRFDFALYKNGALEVEKEGGPSGYTHDRFRTGSTVEGRGFTPGVVSARTNDVFEIYVRHGIGASVHLSGRDAVSPNHPALGVPTANFFMGMYEA